MIEFKAKNMEETSIVSEETSEETLETSEETSEKTPAKIIAIVKRTPQITIQELATRIEVSERSIERNLQKLQRENKLKRVGLNKGGYWKVL